MPRSIFDYLAAQPFSFNDGKDRNDPDLFRLGVA